MAIPPEGTMSAKDGGKPQGIPSVDWDPPLESGVASSEAHALASQRARESRGQPGPSVMAPGIRDHYIADRFPGLARCGGDLEEVAQIIAGARLYFEERKTDRALELLDLAIEQSPFDEPLRLARLEIAFLVRDAALYVTLAREFQAVRRASPAWPEIARLGRALAPDEPLFGAKQGQRSYEHYGPWPQMPNWINASYDMTPEVLAADYHRLMARTAPAAADSMTGVATRKRR
jgi:hypothetical protein